MSLNTINRTAATALSPPNNTSGDLSKMKAIMNIPEIKKYCEHDEKSQELLKKYVDSGKLSARGYHRILKVARTIADLENSKNIKINHLAEALQYRAQLE